MTTPVDERRKLIVGIGAAARRVARKTRRKAKAYAVKRASDTPHRTSELLVALAESEESKGGHMTVQELMDGLGDRSFGLVLLALALPAMPAPPPLNSLIGIPIIMIAWQLLANSSRARLPGFIGKRRIKREDFGRWMRRAEPYIARLERFSKPRLPELVGHRVERITAIFIMVLACCLAIPVPFSNFFPAICIALIALGFIERDGWAVFIGLLMGGFAILFSAILVGVSYAVLTKAFARLFGIFG